MNHAGILLPHVDIAFSGDDFRLRAKNGLVNLEIVAVANDNKIRVLVTLQETADATVCGRRVEVRRVHPGVAK